MTKVQQAQRQQHVAFRYEADLVTELDSQVCTSYFDRPERVHGTIRELPAGRMIPDLIAWWHEDSAQHVVPGLLTTMECVLLSHLRRNGPTRIDVLESRCGVNRGAFRNGALDRLELSHLLEYGRGGRIGLTQDWPPEIRVAAFEAKLTRWRQALDQARSYRRFANEAYVVLPEALKKTAEKHSKQFADEGIGLLVVGEDSVSCICESREVPGVDHDWRRELILSRILDVTIMRKSRNAHKRSNRRARRAAIS